MSNQSSATELVYDSTLEAGAATSWPVHSWVRSIDPLRGVAACAVVVHHAAQAWGLDIQPTRLGTLFAWLGPWGVTLFFVLSGFCIHMPNSRRFAQDDGYAVNWAKFAYRRARRLLPTHYVALILSAIVALFVQTALLSKPTAGSFLAHVFMVHVWYPPYFRSINAVFWSIAVECHFYACYPLYLLLRKKLGSMKTVPLLVAVGLSISLLASVLHIDEVSKRALKDFFLVSWWQWALGAALADLYVNGKAGSWFKIFTSVLAPPIWFVLSIALAFEDFAVGHLRMNHWLLPVICGGLLLSLAVRDKSVPGTVRNEHPLAYLGKFSYSIYLIHPVAYGLLFLIPGYRNLLPLLALIPISIVFAVFISWLFYLLIERHFIPVSKLQPTDAVQFGLPEPVA